MLPHERAAKSQDSKLVNILHRCIGMHLHSVGDRCGMQQCRVFVLACMPIGFILIRWRVLCVIMHPCCMGVHFSWVFVLEAILHGNL